MSKRRVSPRQSAWEWAFPDAEVQVACVRFKKGLIGIGPVPHSHAPLRGPDHLVPRLGQELICLGPCTCAGLLQRWLLGGEEGSHPSDRPLQLHSTANGDRWVLPTHCAASRVHMRFPHSYLQPRGLN